MRPTTPAIEGVVHEDVDAAVSAYDRFHRAFLCERLRGGAADAPTGARDDGDFPLSRLMNLSVQLRGCWIDCAGLGA